MQRVLSIQSHVVFGYVGNKAATFPMQLLGYEVDPLNTVQFSNHTEYKHYTGQRLESSDIAALLQGIILNEFYNEYSHVLTGYVGNASSLTAIAAGINELKNKNNRIKIIVDPVLGDNGKLYVSPELIPIYKNQLLKLADVITPNGFEAEILSGIKVSFANIRNVITKLHELGPSKIVITSVEENNCCKLFGSDGSILFEITIKIKQGSFTGTGDVFSALLLVFLDRMELAAACARAVDVIQAILDNTIKFRKFGKELSLIQSAESIKEPLETCKVTIL